MKAITAALLLCAASQSHAARPAPYEARDYSSLTAYGIFSSTMLENHFKLYRGYVTNTNALLERLDVLEREGKSGSQEYGELKRRFGWEFNGMRLHELYFDNLGPSPLPAGSKLRAALAAQHGSFETWQESFLALPKVRGIGWAALVYDRPAGRLFNVWINEHDSGVPAGAEVLLIMDLFEHAFITDYQLDKAAYAKAFWAAIDWAEAEKRFLGK